VRPAAGPRLVHTVGDKALSDGNSDPFDARRSGRRCGTSDAALVQYYPPVPDKFGRMANTALNSITVTSNVALKAPKTSLAVGNVVRKTGMQTGVTEGTVRATCANVSQWTVSPDLQSYIDTGIDMICQYQGSNFVDAGDSGGPTFQAVNLLV
jgi:trypsin